MPREDKHKHTTAKTPALLLTKQLKLHFAHKLCQEGLFPRRSRWLLAGDLARQLNDVANTIREANETKVVTLDEWGDRHRLLTSAVAKLKADVDAGRRTMEDVQRHYQCFIASAEYSSGDGCIRDMDAYYTKVFRARPVYKRSRRYLYGKKC